jgi:hypothetical protein
MSETPKPNPEAENFSYTAGAKNEIANNIIDAATELHESGSKDPALKYYINSHETDTDKVTAYSDTSAGYYASADAKRAGLGGYRVGVSEKETTGKAVLDRAWTNVSHSGQRTDVTTRELTPSGTRVNYEFTARSAVETRPDSLPSVRRGSDKEGYYKHTFTPENADKAASLITKLALSRAKRVANESAASKKAA